MIRLFSIVLAALVGLSACSKKSESPATDANKAPGAIAPGVNQVSPNSGKILQTQQAAGYTYAEVELNDGRKVWIAGGPIQAGPGDVVQWADYSVMENFHARSLNRTFPQILFVSTWGPVGGTASHVAPHGTQPGQMGMAMPMQAVPMAQPSMPAMPGAGAAPVMETGQGVVKSAKSTGDYTYIEVDQGGKTVWLAANAMAVKSGDKVKWNSSTVMRNFEAKAIGRTFDSIVFAEQVDVIK